MFLPSVDFYTTPVITSVAPATTALTVPHLPWGLVTDSSFRNHFCPRKGFRLVGVTSSLPDCVPLVPHMSTSYWFCCWDPSMPPTPLPPTDPSASHQPLRLPPTLRRPTLATTPTMPRVRFINHSCEPNCRTELWVVHGKNVPALFTSQEVSPSSDP